MFNRRLLAVSVLMCSGLMATDGIAQPQERERGNAARPPRGEILGERGRPGVPGVRMIRQLDTNGDALISLDEFAANATENYARQFERADRDDNGVLSEEEMHREGRGRGPADEIDTAALRECIADNGGLPSLEEDRFASADTNNDGVLSQEEFFMHLEQRAYDQFGRMDVDGNGQLSKEELAANMEDRRTQRSIVRECIAEQIDPFL